MVRKLGLFFIVIASLSMSSFAFGASAAAGKGSAARSSAVAANRVPLYFEKNQGQTASEVRYLARAGGYTAFLKSDETVLLYRNGKPGQKDAREAVVRMKLAGSQKISDIKGEGPLPGVVNYLTGNDTSKWKTHIPTFAQVANDEVYPGVDLTYRADGKQLEFDFRVAPGVNPDSIRMTYSGASKMRLNKAGDLVFDTSSGPASMRKPVAYQDIDGKRVPVSADYALLSGGEVGFHLGKYDHSRTLVIDPTVNPTVEYSTYLGSGSMTYGGDTFSSMAVDSAGEAFICGSTYETSYPTGAASETAYSGTFPSNYMTNKVPAGFVTALNATGTGIIYSTFVSGTNSTASSGVTLNSIAVNSSGNAFVGGATGDSTFPTVKAYQSTFPTVRTGLGTSITTGVVFELASNGGSLVYSTFLGGGDSDSITAIAIDSSNNAYITGYNRVYYYYTDSDAKNNYSGFPVTSGAIWSAVSQNNIGSGFTDAFAAKIAPPSGSGNATLSYSTLIESAAIAAIPQTLGVAIAVDSAGDAYVTGYTNCAVGDHGGTITTTHKMTGFSWNCGYYNFGNQSWILELNPTATAAVYLDYLGGSSPTTTTTDVNGNTNTYSPNTMVAGIQVNSTGRAYVTGTTEANNFQTTSGAYQTAKRLAGVTNGSTEQSDGFVTVIAAGGASFAYSTYLNGSTVPTAAVSANYYGSPSIKGIALDSDGQFAVAGIAHTTDFPTLRNPQGTPLLSAYPSGKAGVPFITKFKPVATGGLVYSTFLGAGDETGVDGIASNGTDIYVMLKETTDGLATTGANDAYNSGKNKELVVRVTDVPLATQAALFVTGVPSEAQVYGATFQVSSSGGSGLGAVTFSGTGACTATGTTVTMISGTGTCSVTATKAEDSTYDSATSDASTVSAQLATSSALSVTGVPSVDQAYGATFTVGSSGGSGSGSVTYSGTDACSASGTTVTMISGTGTCSVTATKESDGNYSSITSAASTVNATLATQPTLSVAGVPSTAQAYGATFTVSSSGGNGSGTVTFSGAGACSVAGTTVTMTSGTGICSVTATKAADSDYLSAVSAASTVNAKLATESTLMVTDVPSTAQAYGAAFTVGTSGGNGSGLVTFSGTGSCTASGTTVTMTSGTGTCSVTATKAADSNYSSITSSASTVSATLATQAALTVTGVPSTAQIYHATFTVGSSGGNGSGTVTFSGTGACSAAGATVTMNSGTGTCSVTATKAADSNYVLATSAASTVMASKATPTISVWPTASSITYGQTLASSHLTGGTPSVSGSFSWTTQATVPGGGTPSESVTFTPTDTTDYSTVTNTISVTVDKAAATVTLDSLTQTYTGTALTATAVTSPANLPVSYAYTQNGQTVTSPTNAGRYGVTATINDDNYSGTASGTLVVNQASQAITFSPLSSTMIYGTSPLSLSATGGASGNAVTYSVLSGPGTVSGTNSNALAITGVGTIVVAANQAGNSNYSAAAQVTQSIVVVSINLNFNVAGMDLGGVPLGSTSSAQTLILTNPSSYPVTITSIQASGDFSATSNCPTIAALGTCSANIVFTPSATGTRTGTLTVTDAQSNTPQTISLTGIGTAPGIQFTPSLVNFGSQVVSTSSTGQTITIMNTGTAALVISQIATSGDFATSGNCASVPAGSNCNLTVIFTPTATGVRSGTVTFTDNAGSQVVNLSGRGTQAGATLTPSVQTFASTLVGSKSFALTATLTNTGTATLTGIGVSTLGDFTQSNTCQATLDPAATCTISVTYAPMVAGAESGSLTVSNNLGTQTVALVGTGIAPGASLSTAQLVFGGQLINTSSQAQTVVLTNTGSAPVTISSVAPTANFTDTTNCSGAIAAGASCSVNIFFAPTATGLLSGTLTITDDAGTQVVAMQGRGTSAGLSVSPSFEIFGAQIVGTTSQAQTLIATNTGTMPLTLNSITVSSNFSESDQCSTPLQVGASCSISLSFSPTSIGTLSGSLVISDTTGVVSTIVTLSGQGTLPGIATSPSTLFFGSLPVGTTSQAQTVTVSNTGTAPLQIGTITGNGDFAETDNCSSQTIAVGSNCVISITMTPTTVGTRTGTIQFNDNADGLHQIALSGMGQQTGVSISPTSLAFGSYPIASATQSSTTTGTTLSVTIANTGNLPVQLNGFDVQGDFAESDSCGGSVAVGATCSLTVSFKPTALGHRTGTLTISDNAGGGMQSVSLAGDGSPSGVTLLPPVLNFGLQSVGVKSKPQIATLSNNTGSSITDLAITASGEYSETDDCGTTLANGATCTLNITVTPEINGAITGTITISTGGSIATSSQVMRHGVSSSASSSQVKPQGVSSSTSSTDFGVVAVSATTDTNSATPVSQLVFGTSPYATVSLGGNAGAIITVLEKNSSGGVVAWASDTVTLTVTGPNSYAKTYSATAVGGVATFNLSSNALTTAGSYTYTATVTDISSAIASEAVSRATPTIILQTSSNQSLLDNAVSFTATVSSTLGTPTGTVNFMKGSELIGQGTLSGGVTTFTTSSLTVGSDTIIAAYSGDTNFIAVSSDSLSQQVFDFTLSTASGIGGSGASQTVLPGGSATYTIGITPSSGSTLPAKIVLTVTGLPSGATATLAGSSWTQLTSTSWQLPANTALANVSLTVNTPSQTANLSQKDVPFRSLPPVLWGLLLLPFAGRMRRIGKRMGQRVTLLLLLAIGAASIVGLSGCGSSSGQQQKTYNVTVTVTTGALSHSTNVVLTVK